MTTMTTTLAVVSSRFGAAAENPYVAYAYSYPHKSAYGSLTPPVALAPLWQSERRDALFLYVHVPFCEMRCGFCNLFTRAGADYQLIDAYLDALQRQAHILADATAGDRRIARLAVGGGTPTILSEAQLERLFDLVEHGYGASPSRIPTSVETSPKTATPSRVQCLRRRGVERVSIGVQSFFDHESHAIGRPQSIHEVRSALDRLRSFPVLNIDLIYGQPMQTVGSWLESVRMALRYRPQELYLYPLYVRPGTGIGRKGFDQHGPPSFTRRLYREARDLLVAEGYKQISMRCFQASWAPDRAGPVYCCQTDGMLGLGCGARSYTSRLHYSSRFAVEAGAVGAIIEEWLRQEDADMGHATWGYVLSEDDRRRRFVIQSLLLCSGLDESDYVHTFGTAPVDDFPELTLLTERGFAEREDHRWRLTPLGFEFSDFIGPSLYSPANLARVERFART